MSSYSRYGRPALKNSVDVQLQSAFSDGNWATAARLAQKRFQTFKDPYYEAVKICAEAQLDGTAEKVALIVAIEELVKQKTTPDPETIELYEWASKDFLYDDLEYADTLGPLRARWVKANPKSPLALQCLQTCLDYWDLVSAQQIATTLDKAYVNSSDRRYMFWSIILTYLLSISHQCSESSRKVYSLLVDKQLERAANLTDDTPEAKKTDRVLLLEEEICFYYRVLLKHGLKQEYLDRLKSSRIGPIAQLKAGNKLLFCEAIETLESWGEWDRIYDLCRDGLTLGLDGETPTFFVCDWRVWKKFATAASKTKDPEAAMTQVQSVLKRYIDLRDKANQLYKRNIALALLETTFRLPLTVLDPNHENKGLSSRVAQLGLFLEQYFDRRASFDDVKDYVADLSFEEIQAFMKDVLPKLADDKPEKPQKMALKVLESKLWYLLTTCPQTLTPNPSTVDGQEQDKTHRCRFCSNLSSFSCDTCLKKVVANAADLYSQIGNDKDLLDGVNTLDRDPRLDLALVMGTALLKLSGLQSQIPDTVYSPLQDVDAGVLLQAVLLMDTQLKQTPGDNGLRLLLVQLYILLGATSYAHQLWIPMDVKRTIQDALSPLLFDRISSISPGMFQGSRTFTEPLRSYYYSCFRDECPLRIWDAFHSGSYTSILDMTAYDLKLRTSCTLVMTLVEERRATRCYGGKVDFEVDEHPLTASIGDATALSSNTDYGSFPNLESKHGPAIHAYLRVGPGLSNTRSHLALLSEQYTDLLTYKPPKDYKPAKPHDVAAKDRAYILETLARLSTSLTDYIHNPSTPSLLTGPETAHYTIVSLLSASLLAGLSTSRADPSPPKTLSLLTSTIKKTLAALRAGLFAASNPTMAHAPGSFSLTTMHALSCLREAAIVARHTASFALAFQDRELARDRSGRSGLHRDVVAEMKALDAAGQKALADVKSHIQRLKESLSEGGWLDTLLDMVFGGEDEEGQKEDDAGRKAVVCVAGGRAEAEEWAGKVLESWRETVKGWGMVKME